MSDELRAVKEKIMVLEWRMVVEVKDEQGRKRWIEGPQQRCEVTEGTTLQHFGEAVHQALMGEMMGGGREQGEGRGEKPRETRRGQPS